VRAVLIDESIGHLGVGDVGGHRAERVAELVAQPIELHASASDTDNVRAGVGQRSRDGTAESPADAGHDRRRAGQRVGLVLNQLINGHSEFDTWRRRNSSLRGR
jgi:hypothetical protein